MCRELQHALYSNGTVDWDAFVAASPGAVDELLWFVGHLAEWNRRGIPIWKRARVVDLVLTQDSSPTGVGFRVESDSDTVLEGHMPFNLRESGLAHVHREMVGLVFVVAVLFVVAVEKKVGCVVTKRLLNV